MFNIVTSLCMLRFAWNKNQMVDWVKFYIFVIICVIQNMHVFLRNYARNIETTVIWLIALLLLLRSKCRTRAVHQIKKPKWIAWLLSLLAEIKVLIFWSSSSSLIIYDIFIKIKIWIEQIKTFWQCATDTQSDQPFLS